MTPRLGDIVAIKATENKQYEYLLGAITEISDDALFKIEWDNGNIVNVTIQIATEYRQNFLDNS